MKPKGMRQATIDGLKFMGWIRDESAKTSKYEVYYHPTTPVFMLVGKSGALRVTKGAVSHSTSITGTKQHRAIQCVGREACWTTAEQTQRAYEHEMERRLAK